MDKPYPRGHYVWYEGGDGVFEIMDITEDTTTGWFAYNLRNVDDSQWFRDVPHDALEALDGAYQIGQEVRYVSYPTFGKRFVSAVIAVSPYAYTLEDKYGHQRSSYVLHMSIAPVEAPRQIILEGVTIEGMVMTP